MGGVSCRQGQQTQVAASRKGGNIQVPWVQGRKSLWSGVGTMRSGLEELWELQGHQCLHQETLEKPLSEWPVPQFIDLFLPEFPVRPIRRQQQLKILGLVAKGSFGTVLKVLDCAQKAVFAVKVVSKVKVLQKDTLRQCKEEVSIQFPVAAERDHVAMLASVTHCDSEIPVSLKKEFSFLLQELLCQNPLHRLRYLHHFQVHPFFRGVAFDPELLQKQPVNFVMETQDTQTSPLESMPFKDFDCDLEPFLVHSIPA
ncbi:ribosomal protein S6 kinase-related protein isoform 10-T10 [Erethizon dorsatum]